jgi:hypothetical protein
MFRINNLPTFLLGLGWHLIIGEICKSALRKKTAIYLGQNLLGHYLDFCCEGS